MVKEVEKENAGNPGALADPEVRKKFRSQLATVTHYMRQIDDHKEGMKESVAELSSQYGLDKRTVRKLAAVMYAANYTSIMEENRHFEYLYENIIEGGLRDPDDLSPKGDPLDSK